MNMSKAAEPDDVSGHILTTCVSHLLMLLRPFCNIAVSQETLPTSFKKTIITLEPKKPTGCGDVVLLCSWLQVSYEVDQAPEMTMNSDNMEGHHQRCCFMLKYACKATSSIPSDGS